MAKRIIIITSVLVIAFWGCSRSTQVTRVDPKAEEITDEDLRDNFRPGTSLLECKALSINPDLSIKFRRRKNNVCEIEDETIFLYENLYCEGDIFKPITPKVETKPNELPKEAFSGSGNQACPEAIVKYEKSPPCYQYTTGGRTYFIGPG